MARVNSTSGSTRATVMVSRLLSGRSGARGYPLWGEIADRRVTVPTKQLESTFRKIYKLLIRNA